MSITLHLDRCADLHPLDAKGNSTSFNRNDIDQIAYKLPGDEDFSYITAATDDDEIDHLAAHLVATNPNDAADTARIAETLKQCRDQMQGTDDDKEGWTPFAKEIDAALTAAGIEHRTDYSGRGMYGAQCIGVDCEGRTSPSEEEVLEAVKNVKGGLAPARDSMGLGRILYWPAAQTKEGRY